MPTIYSLIPEHSHQTANTVLVAWPYPKSDWQANLNSAEKCYSDMIDTLSRYCCVIVLLHPSIDKICWLERYKDKHFLLNRDVRVVNTIDYNDTWVRDYGPLSAIKTNTENETHDANDKNNTGLCKPVWMCFHFNGWGGKYPSELDNNASALLAQSLSQPLIKHDYILEGGAVEVNQRRILLANKTCVVNSNRNQNLTLKQHESIIANALNIQQFAWLNVPPLTGDDTDGHIDTIARFVSDDHVVYTQPNTAHPDNTILIELESQLIKLAHVHSWQLTGLPTPQVYSCLSPQSLLPATYANFLIVGNTVFIPFYGVKSDMVAFDVLKSVFDRYNLAPINCIALLEQSGSLHCATMQLTL